MIISNFEITHTIGDSSIDKEYSGKFSVTTGMLWWKKTQIREIYRHNLYWFFP